jgi:galactokinase
VAAGREVPGWARRRAVETRLGGWSSGDPYDDLRGELCQEFEVRFGRRVEFLARAPGRVNLIGEHTDYSEGLVLPCAIDRELWLAAAPRRDGRFRVWSRELADGGGPVEFEVDDLRPRGSWIDYVQGAAFAALEAGYGVGGLDVAVASELPRESGLSSSAALGVAVCLAIARAEGLALDARELARLAHRGESHFVGTPCGILDPFAIALARRDHALRIDCRSQAVEAIPFSARLLIVHSGSRGRLAPAAQPTSDVTGSAEGYRERVAQCRAAFEAARAARIVGPEAASLRDLDPADLPALERALDPLSFRRARHVISENRRVEACCAELRRGARADLRRIGEILKQAQTSLRDDFAVSTPELDYLCDTADRIPGVFGSRLTGAGFGGCTLHLVSEAELGRASDRLAAAFEARFERRPLIIPATTRDGASILEAGS